MHLACSKSDILKLCMIGPRLANPCMSTAAVCVSIRLHVEVHPKAPTEEIAQQVITLDNKTEAFHDMAGRSPEMT